MLKSEVDEVDPSTIALSIAPEQVGCIRRRGEWTGRLSRIELSGERALDSGDRVDDMGEFPMSLVDALRVARDEAVGGDV